MPCTTTQGQHHLLVSIVKINLCQPWLSSAMALGHHVERGASTCCPFILFIDITRVGRLGKSPSKNPQEHYQLGMRSHECVEKTRSQVTSPMLPKHPHSSCHHQQQIKAPNTKVGQVWLEISLPSIIMLQFTMCQSKRRSLYSNWF